MILNTEQAGPALWTGEAMVPEARLLSVRALVPGVAVILVGARMCRGELAVAGGMAGPPEWAWAIG